MIAKPRVKQDRQRSIKRLAAAPRKPFLGDVLEMMFQLTPEERKVVRKYTTIEPKEITNPELLRRLKEYDDSKTEVIAFTPDEWDAFTKICRTLTPEELKRYAKKHQIRTRRL